MLNKSNSLKIGFVGAGNMAMAIVKGLINYGGINPKKIFVSAPSNKNLPKFKSLGCNTTNDNLKLVYQFKCSVIFLCVKPQHVNSNSIFELNKIYYYTVIISLIPGFSLDALYKYCLKKNLKNKKCLIYRLMPNLACEIGTGFCAISPVDNNFDECLLEILKKIFTCFFMPENDLDKFLALSCSGIAFVYTFIQAMTDAGVKIGIARNTCLKTVLQTIYGACDMLSITKKHPIQLRDDVCSPAGTTIYGINILEEMAFSASVMKAVERSYERCSELRK